MDRNNRLQTEYMYDREIINYCEHKKREVIQAWKAKGEIVVAYPKIGKLAYLPPGPVIDRVHTRWFQAR